MSTTNHALDVFILAAFDCPDFGALISAGLMTDIQVLVLV